MTLLSSSTEPGPPAAGGLPLWTPWVLAAGLEAALVFVLDLDTPGPGEGLSLRWLRSVAGHPVRSSLALGLGLWAFLEPWLRRGGGAGTRASEGL